MDAGGEVPGVGTTAVGAIPVGAGAIDVINGLGASVEGGDGGVVVGGEGGEVAGFGVGHLADLLLLLLLLLLLPLPLLLFIDFFDEREGPRPVSLDLDLLLFNDLETPFPLLLLEDNVGENVTVGRPVGDSVGAWVGRRVVGACVGSGEVGAWLTGLGVGQSPLDELDEDLDDQDHPPFPPFPLPVLFDEDLPFPFPPIRKSSQTCSRLCALRWPRDDFCSCSVRLRCERFGSEEEPHPSEGDAKQSSSSIIAKKLVAAALRSLLCVDE